MVAFLQIVRSSPRAIQPCLSAIISSMHGVPERASKVAASKCEREPLYGKRGERGVGLRPNSVVLATDNGPGCLEAF